MPSPNTKPEKGGYTAGPGVTQAETRVTPWSDFGHYGFSAYRIWQRYEGRTFYQRHEWKRDDGSIRMDDWIIGVSYWAPNAARVEGAL